MVNGDLCLEISLSKVQQKIGYDDNRVFIEWNKELKEKFIS